jgi:glycosyltransferase involved in cell wall biosynthesis
MPKVFVSDAVHQERLIFDPQSPGGHGPRGWKALSTLYQASLIACQYRVEPVVRPEIYQTGWARTARGVAAGDWHMAVKPIEHVRPFHGIPNVFVCDWPFPELSTAPRGESPFFDQARLLRMADAVLCCTSFTADTLRSAGVERVLTLPPYIPPPRRNGAAARLRGRHSFLCVADTDHRPRQLGPAIEGFAQAAAQRGDLRLVVLLPEGDEQALTGIRQLVAAAAPVANGTISIVTDVTVAGLLDAADFMLCGASHSGLHLPLVKAMLAGVPLVTTVNSGTASFLPPGAAVPIGTQPKTLDGDDEPIGRWMPLTANPPAAQSVCDAILVAASLDEAARLRMASAARAVAEHRFGLAAFEAGLVRLGAFIPLDRR